MARELSPTGQRTRAQRSCRSDRALVLSAGTRWQVNHAKKKRPSLSCQDERSTQGSPSKPKSASGRPLGRRPAWQPGVPRKLSLPPRSLGFASHPLEWFAFIKPLFPLIDRGKLVLQGRLGLKPILVLRETLAGRSRPSASLMASRSLSNQVHFILEKNVEKENTLGNLPSPSEIGPGFRLGSQFAWKTLWLLARRSLTLTDVRIFVSPPSRRAALVSEGGGESR